MFIRVIRKTEDKEILVNTDHIWKIEVQYVIPKDRVGFKTGLRKGAEDPDAIRVYKVFFGGDTVTLSSDPSDSVVAVIEKIYNEAIKAGGPRTERES